MYMMYIYIGFGWKGGEEDNRLGFGLAGVGEKPIELVLEWEREETISKY